jgi:hypothetical protein
LSWTDQPGPRPRRSEGQLLDVVRGRATRLRRQRRTRLSAGLCGLVALVVVAAALAREGDDRSSQLRVVGPIPTTATTALATTIIVEPTTTTASLSDAPSTTTAVRATAPPTTRTTLPAAPPTTARPTTTTVPSTTTTEPPALTACDPADVVVTATPERSSYPKGTTVVVIAAAQNRGSRACTPFDPKVEFADSTGTGMGGVGVFDRFTMGWPGQPPPSWQPGETLSHPFEWPQWCGLGGDCAPGTYTATVSFGPFRSAPAPFTIT